MAAIVFTAVLSVVLDFSTLDWSLTNGNATLKTKGQIPSSVHMDLLAAGIIEEPYKLYNDVNQRWITKENWTYSSTFNIKRHARNSLTLVAEGVDTRADIRINDKLVLSTDNMFTRYEVLVDHTVLKDEGNHITIKFFSPFWYAQNQADTYPNPPSDGIPPGCPPASYNGICHGNFMRKEPSSFGWDWGPAFAPSGVYKAMYFMENETPLQATMRVKKGDQDWNLEVLLTKTEKEIATLTVIGSDGSTKATHTGIESVINLSVQNVSTWWPRGYGDQPLYTVTVVVGTQVLKKHIGFRTVELVQDETLDMSGRTFYFKVNGVGVFMKGANFVPADAFETRVTHDRLEDLFNSFYDANFNAIRVWGGGVYQQDYFYDLADKHGILLWQESMFACAMYPADDSFLSSVEAEITHQVNRLTHHPSLVVWSTNNENEAALVQDWYGKTSPAENPEYTDMYRNLYWKTILSNITSLDDRPVLASSPSAGWKETEANPVLSECNDDNNGDVHYYDYTSDCWDVTKLKSPRFASEFGLQSWSSYESLQSVAADSDLAWGSAWTQQRQHCDPNNCGNNAMKAQASLHYRWPSNFTDQIYMTQVQQAYCIRVQVEHHRRNRDAGPHTMGTLFWQANDAWQTVSWSSLEYNTQWKMLHYYAQLFYADMMLSAHIETEEYQVMAVNDRGIEVGGLAQFKLYKWSGGNPYTWVVPFSVEARESVMVEKGKVNDLIKQNDCGAAAECVLYYSLTEDSGHVTYENFLLLDSPKLSITLGNPNLRIQNVVQSGPRSYQLTIVGERNAPFTWLSFLPTNREAPAPVRWSRNGFLYTTDVPIVVTLECNEKLSVGDVAARTMIRSLGSLS
eukprot:TRINITY_DN1452_c0_g2_i1.p1 TRINITY_DN1452_c0_g2~~TRINITY_DN1452_c0_g2_i1.p1  ORF type:complete len:853 (+),score=209.75 TRINITY_DN1452_c0_g2_i1:755-3313(+)